MPSKNKKEEGNARRNKIVLLIGIAAILLLTSVYQLVTLNGSLSVPQPQFVEKFETEMAKAEAMQQTVREHIAKLEAANAANADSDAANAEELLESKGQIAELSKSIHDLQAKYVKLAASNPQAGVAVDAGSVKSGSGSQGTDSRQASRDIAASALAAKSNKKQSAQSNPALRGGPVHPGSSLDIEDNHGPGGKGHLIPDHIASPTDAGAQARAAANADPAVRKLQEDRADQIREAIRFVWKNYKQHAWGQDNLNPVSGRGASAGFGHAVTLLDSLDTLWIAGLKDEFQDAVDYASKNLEQKLRNVGGGVSAFETTIRSLGGIEGAYALSKDERLVPLMKAIGKRLNDHVGKNGITSYRISGGKGGMGCNTLAESGTNQLEFNFLADVVGDSSIGSKSAAFYPYIDSRPSLDGLYPNCFERGRGKITFGADGDSFYEYLVKVWLQTGRKDDRLWRMYNAAIDGMDKWLVQKGPDGLTYLMNLNWNGNTKGQDHAMEHLSCFVPAWLMLGQDYQTDPDRKAHIRELAEQIAYTCWQMYEQQPTGIAPERVKSMAMDLSKTDTREYILRPEALEGFWYMWELTGDSKYREWSWKIFENFQKYLKVGYGYASLKDVRNPRSGKFDRMESFFLAETMKYMYLLHDPDQSIRLREYVFNTEGHPLPLPKS